MPRRASQIYLKIPSKLKKSINKRLDIITVCYNHSDFLDDFFSSFLAVYGELPCNVWVADNASQDDSLSRLLHWQNLLGKSLKLIVNKENIGFAKANNKLARLGNNEYLLFLNPDVKFSYDFISPCIDLAATREALIAPRLIDPIYGHFRHYALFPDRLLSVFPQYWYGLKSFFDTIEVDWLQGACWILPRKIFEEVGGFNEHYFVFTEDLEFCSVLHDLGVARLLANTQFVNHPRTRMNQAKQDLIRDNMKYYFRNRDDTIWMFHQHIRESISKFFM